MAIKLEIYLKRTEQSLEDWLRANDITKHEDFLPRCAYLGFATNLVDLANVKKILEPKAPQVQVEQNDKKQKKKKVVLGETDV